MRVQIEGKAFNLELKNGFVFVKESSRIGNWWIKFPLGLFGWLSNSLCHFSSLVELKHYKRVGSLLWEVKSSCNRRGWFLELSVSFGNARFSIMVPAESSFNPWKRFVDSFFQVANVENQGSRLTDFQTSPKSEFFEPLQLMLGENRDVVNSDIRFLKEGVDNVLELECIDFGLSPLQFGEVAYTHQSSLKLGVDEILASECIGFPSSDVVSFECCVDGASKSTVGSNCLVCSESSGVGVVHRDCEVPYDTYVDDPGVSCPSSQRKGISKSDEVVHGVDDISSFKSSSGSDFFEPSSLNIEVVSSFPCVLNSRKKKFNPAKIAIISFPIEVSTKDNAPLFKDPGYDLNSHDNLVYSLSKPCMATRLSSRGNAARVDSPWDCLPKGVKCHPISKYCDLPSQGVDRMWVLKALELGVKATDKEIFKRMYQFQKAGKINIKRKVIRILEGIHNDGIPWGVRRS